MDLDRVLHGDEAVLWAGNGAADDEHIQLRIDLDDLKVLDGDGLAAHLARAAGALEDTAGISARAAGTDVTVDGAAAVGLALDGKAAALDDALVAVALAGAGHVNEIADLEHIGLDDGAELQLAAIVEVELAQVLLGGNAGLVEMADFRLGQLLFSHVLKAQLNSLITILFGGLLLRNDTGARFDHGDRDHTAVFVEDLRHANFFADDCFHV